jgi:hypothetical protein
MRILPSIRKPAGRIIPTLLCQSIQRRGLLKLHRTNRVLTGKCGSPPCQRRKNTPGLSIWFGSCSTMMPTRSVYLRRTHFQLAPRSLFGRRSTDISSRSRTIPVTSGGRANYSEAGFRHSRPTILGCAAFCSRLAGSVNLHKGGCITSRLESPPLD